MINLEQYKSELFLNLNNYLTEYEVYLKQLNPNDFKSIQYLSEHLQEKIEAYKGSITSAIFKNFPYNNNVLNEEIRFHLFHVLASKYSKFDELTKQFWATKF